MIIKKVDVYLTLTPEELAIEFCKMHSDEQCRFFNAIGKEVKENWDAPFGVQMATVFECKKLDNNGLGILLDIKELMEAE